MFDSKSIIAYVLILMGVCSVVSAAVVNAGERAETWDFYVPISYMESTDIDGPKGSDINLNKDFGIGFGFGYNFSNKFQLGGLYTWSSRSYDAKVILEDDSIRRYGSRLDNATLAMKGIYHFLEGDFTPFVSGLIGLTHIDTNIPIGPPSDTCWWDPWWGWVCTSYVPTKTETALSYGCGLGLRYDINHHFGMKFSYNIKWIDTDSAVGTPDIDSWALSIILRY